VKRVNTLLVNTSVEEIHKTKLKNFKHCLNVSADNITAIKPKQYLKYLNAENKIENWVIHAILAATPAAKKRRCVPALMKKACDEFFGIPMACPQALSTDFLCKTSSGCVQLTL